MIDQFMIGADPEVFVRKNGKPISAYGLIPGTKSEPFKTDHGAVQVDGMALEFNINPSPLSDFDSFNSNIINTLSDLRKMAGNVNMNIQPVQEFDADYMVLQPEEAKELGCDPDFNAYTMAVNPRPDGDRLFRTGAGHIHIGWGADIPIENEEHMEICSGFVKMLDATVGMLMTYIDRDPRRRELYGKAGAFRPKSYGVEYRTPSNVWIKNRDRREFVHSLVRLAVNRHTGGYTPHQVAFGTVIPQEESEKRIQDIINNGDTEQAYLALVRFSRNINRGNQLLISIVHQMKTENQELPF